jgi:hypothetical protein
MENQWTNTAGKTMVLEEMSVSLPLFYQKYNTKSSEKEAGPLPLRAGKCRPEILQDGMLTIYIKHVIIYIKTADSSGHCNMYTFGFLTTRGDF